MFMHVFQHQYKDNGTPLKTLRLPASECKPRRGFVGNVLHVPVPTRREAGPAKAESKAKDEPRGKSGLQSLQKLYELSESHV